MLFHTRTGVKLLILKFKGVLNGACFAPILKYTPFSFNRKLLLLSAILVLNVSSVLSTLETNPPRSRNP